MRGRRSFGGAVELLRGVAHVVTTAILRHESELERRESEERFRHLSDHALVGIYLAQDGILRYVNRALADMLGYDVEELTSADPFALIAAEDVDRLRTSMDARGAGLEDERHYEFGALRKDGSLATLEVYATVTTLDHRPAIVGNVLDVTAEREARQLAAQEHQFRLLAENTSDIVWHVDADGRVMWVSPAVQDILGWRPEDLLGTIGVELAHPDDLERARRARDHVVAGGTVHDHFRFRCADGGQRWVDLSDKPLPDAEGGGRVVAMRDIQAIVEARTQLEHVSDHDTVTGLANRTAVLAHIDDQLARGSGSSRSLAVLGVRVDSLAPVNAAFTHAVGDVVLATLAHRIEEIVGRTGLVGRGTGAEFLVVLPDLPEPSSAAVTAELVRQAAKAPLVAEGHEIRSTVSIGIATGGPGVDPALLVRDAGLATRRAREDGRDRIAFFDPSLALEAERSVAVLADVRAALVRGELVAWYQPIVRFGADRVVGFEALVRWQRADGVLVPPNEFLPVVEQSAQIADVDLAVLDQAARALSQLSSDLFVSVNVSARTLTLVDYADEIVRAVRTAGVDPARLHVEVTETTLLSVSEAVDTAMRAVARTGARWYVDDFGTGFSSIAHLRDLPVSGLKLDLSFTAGILNGDTRSTSLAQALAGMAHGLGLDTVAEGVETEQQAAVLAAQGWQHGQGWLYDRARPLDEWLAPGDDGPWPTPVSRAGRPMRTARAFVRRVSRRPRPRRSRCRPCPETRPG